MKMVSCYVLLLLLIASTQAGELFYRYVDENGVTVISSKIPADYVPRGYELIDEGGTLVKKVLPEPTEDEKKEINQQRREQARLKVWDEELLRKYSHPNDILDAKSRKLVQSQNDLGVIQREIEKINADIQYYQDLAAADEREGREINADTLAKIESLRRDMEAELIKKNKKELERQSVADQYDKDSERFKLIRPDKR